MVCLDSSFIIDILHGNKKAEHLKQSIDNSQEDIYVPAPVVMELSTGAELSKHIEKEKDKVRKFLSSIDILDFNYECAILAGEIEADLIKMGNIIEIEDIMIAAVALQNNEALITRNKKHFEKIPNLKIQSY